jgi:hypothetical protein
MKTNFTFGILVLGFVWGFIQHAIEVSEPPISQLYEQNHKLTLKFLVVPARGYQFDSLSVHSKHFLFFKQDSALAEIALNNLIRSGYFADSVTKREVFLSNETLNLLIKGYETNTIWNQIKFVPYIEPIDKLRYYYSIKVCTSDFDIAVDSLPQKSIEFLNPYSNDRD